MAHGEDGPNSSILHLPFQNGLFCYLHITFSPHCIVPNALLLVPQDFMQSCFRLLRDTMSTPWRAIIILHWQRVL